MRVQFKSVEKDKMKNLVAVEMAMPPEVGEVVWVDDKSFKVCERQWSIYRIDATPMERADLIVYVRPWEIA